MFWVILTIVLGVAKWVVYTTLLWIMIKIQKLQYNVLGLLGSSALATAIGYIPVVGPYVGGAVLVFCLWKVTRAEIAPDVLFTVTIAGALMFCVNLFVIGWLMGNLGFAGTMAGADDDNEMDGAPVALVHNSTATNDDDDDDADEIEKQPAAKPATPVVAMPPAQTNPPVVAKSMIASSPAPKPAPLLATTKPATVAVDATIRDASSLPTKLSLKGLGVHSAQRTAMIGDGKEIHTVAVGDMFSVPSPRGNLLLRCEDITAREVILALEKGDRVRLTFQ